MLLMATTTDAQNLIPFKDFKNLGLYGYKDNKGNIIITSRYNDAKAFSEGLAAVSKADYDDFGNESLNWGFIDTTGNVIIPMLYDNWSFFKAGKAEVEIKGRKFYIDKTGKEINSSEDNPKSKSTVTLSDVDKQLVSIYQEIQQLVKIDGDKFNTKWKSMAYKFKNRMTTKQDESSLRVAYEEYNNLINISKNKADKIPANENNMNLKSAISKFCDAEQNVALTMYVMLRETDRKYFEDNITRLENEFKKRDNYGAQLVTQYKIFIGELPKVTSKP